MSGNTIKHIRHGLVLAVLAMVLGVCWAAYLAIFHEQLHDGFTKQEATIKAARSKQGVKVDTHRHVLAGMLPSGANARTEHDDSHAATPDQRSHSGNLALDAMRRLLRGHVHWMGVGILSAVMLLITGLTSLKPCWKKLLGWSFGIGAVAYPPAWILMGFRTVLLGPKAAEKSVMWLFGPAVSLVLASLITVLAVLLLEMFCLHKRCSLLARFFEQKEANND